MLDRDLEPACEGPSPHMQCPNCCVDMDWDNGKLHFKCIQCDEWFDLPAPDLDEDGYDENWRYVYDY